MEIIINGQLAAIKKGSSFQFITENRAFTGSDAYSLNIVFPLKGCAQNLKIFGNIGRMDVSKEILSYDCEIREKDFVRLGTITITSVSPEEVKTQFLEGRSEQNFASTFDEIFINELDLGTPSDTSLTKAPSAVWAMPAELNYVALPWVNNTSGNIQNKADYDPANKRFSWSSDTKGLSFQPYLTYIIKRLADAIGYSIDISALESSNYRYLLICNTLPFSWGYTDFAKALPHWSVTEFFEELEKLLNGEFDIDHRSKSIVFAFSDSLIENLSPIVISNVVDQYTDDISPNEDQCEYQESANLKYADPGHAMWKFCDCPWLINHFKNYRHSVSTSRNTYEVVTENWVQEYNTFKELYNAAYALKDSGTTSTGGRTSTEVPITAKVLYAKDIDTYFCFYTLWYEEIKNDRTGSSSFRFHMALLPINLFGERVMKENNANTMEMNIVPAWIDYTDEVNGDILFLESGSLDTESDAVMLEGERGGRAYMQPHVVRVCQDGDRKKSVEYYNKIYVGFYKGPWKWNTPSYLPRPAIDAINLRADWSYHYDYLRNLRLNANTKYAPRHQHFVLNTEQKFNFSFLSHVIPNVRSLFLINGHRYLCEKITSTFSENGMSELQKGVFYEVTEVNTSWPNVNIR